MGGLNPPEDPQLSVMEKSSMAMVDLPGDPQMSVTEAAPVTEEAIQVGVVVNTGQEAAPVPTARTVTVMMGVLEVAGTTALAAVNGTSALVAVNSTPALVAKNGIPATMMGIARAVGGLGIATVKIRLGCPILAPAQSPILGPSPFPLDLHLAMGPNI